MALDIAAGTRPRMFSLTRSDKIEPLGEALAIIDFARAQVCIARSCVFQRVSGCVWWVCVVGRCAWGHGSQSQD